VNRITAFYEFHGDKLLYGFAPWDSFRTRKAEEKEAFSRQRPRSARCTAVFALAAYSVFDEKKE
jgi:hypothetical protein